MKQATNLVSKVGFGLVAAASLASSVLATGMDYTYGTDYSTAPDAAAAGGIMALGGVWFVFICCMLIVSIAALAFNIWMIIDVMKRTEAELPNRQTWMIVLIIGLLVGFGFIASLIYYFGTRKSLPAISKK